MSSKYADELSSVRLTYWLGHHGATWPLYQGVFFFFFSSSMAQLVDGTSKNNIDPSVWTSDRVTVSEASSSAGRKLQTLSLHRPHLRWNSRAVILLWLGFTLITIISITSVRFKQSAHKILYIKPSVCFKRQDFAVKRLQNQIYENFIKVWDQAAQFAFRKEKKKHTAFFYVEESAVKNN